MDSHPASLSLSQEPDGTTLLECLHGPPRRAIVEAQSAPLCRPVKHVAVEAGDSKMRDRAAEGLDHRPVRRVGRVIPKKASEQRVAKKRPAMLALAVQAHDAESEDELGARIIIRTSSVTHASHTPGVRIESAGVAVANRAALPTFDLGEARYFDTCSRACHRGLGVRPLCEDQSIWRSCFCSSPSSRS